MVCAALMRPLNPMHSELRRPFEHLELHVQSETNGTDDSNPDNSAFNTDAGISPTVNAKVAKEGSVDIKTPTTNIDDVDCNHVVTWKQKLHRAASFVCLSLFVKHPVFCVICFAQVLEGFGYGTVASHLVNRAFAPSISKFDSSMLLTYLAYAMLVARIFHVFIIYYKFISPMPLLGITIGTFGVAILLNPVTDNYAVLVTLACIIGLSLGTYQALIPVSIREQVGVEDTGVGVGWDYFFMGICCLIGPLFSGEKYYCHQ
ncbi:uncharacterized protein LOC144433085 [Glandiceps talaboti]